MASASAQSEDRSTWSEGAPLEGAPSVEPSDGVSDRDLDLDRGDDLNRDDGGLDRGDEDLDGDGVDGDGGGDGKSGGGRASYKFPAFTPLSEERAKIVQHEIRQISPRTKEALEEVGAIV